MKKLLFILLYIPAIVMAQKEVISTAKTTLTLEDIFLNGKYAADGAPAFYMLPDGKHYARADKEGVIRKYHFENANEEEVLFDVSKAKGIKPKDLHMEEFSISPSGRYFLIKTNSEHIYRHSNRALYYIYDKKENTMRIVNGDRDKTLDDGRVFYASISPDEKYVAYVYRNNLYIENIDGSGSKAITTDGEMNKIINGKSDWVYEEELVVVQAYQWNKSGDKIAFYRFDESHVKEYTLTKYDGLYPLQYSYKYPVAGEDNSEVSIWIYDVSSTQKMKLDVGEKNDQYIPRIKWTSDNNILSFQRMNRLQNKLELLFADATTGKIEKIYNEESNTYIDITDNLYFMADNSFIIGSGKEGFNQLYYYNNKGKLIRKLTTENTDVNDIISVDEKNRRVYFRAQPNPIIKNIFYTSIDKPKTTVVYATKEMENETRSMQFSADYSYTVLTTTSSLHPANVFLVKDNKTLLKTLVENKECLQKCKNSGMPQKEFMSIPIGENSAAGGSQYLNIWMMKPADFNPSKKYKVMFSIYSGPGSQTVNNAWGGGMDMWYTYLTQQDIIVVSVDNRGTGARGETFQKCTYKKMGELESDDQITAAKWLAKQPYIDGGRIGIYGWSFGGYMSSLCLMKGADAFKLGVAVAPVTDWKYYDNIYTERYMQLPKDNPEGYKITSVIPYAKNLKGKYLLIHGTYDDNVHPQNSMDLITELVRQGKEFDTEFYPDKNHSIYGGNTRYHLYSRVTRFILENL